MKTPITHTLRSNIIVAIFSIIESANRSVQNFILSKNTWRSLDLLTIYFYAICIWRRLLPSELSGKGVRLLNIYWTIHAESVHSFCLFLWFFWHYMDETMQVRNLLIHYIWFKMKWRVESGCRGIQACVNIIITEKPTNNFGTLSNFVLQPKRQEHNAYGCVLSWLITQYAVEILLVGDSVEFGVRSLNLNLCMHVHTQGDEACEINLCIKLQVGGWKKWSSATQ